VSRTNEHPKPGVTLHEVGCPFIIGAVCVVTLGLLPGCMSSTWTARRLAARMLDPRTSPKRMFVCRQKLRDLTPASDQYLADAFFPIGLYDVPESALQEIAAAGFNLVVNGGKDERYLRRAEAAGLRVIPYVRVDRMADDVTRARDARAVPAWSLFDEPYLNQLAPE